MTAGDRPDDAGPSAAETSRAVVAGPVVQAGTISGGVHHHPPPARQVPRPRQLPASPASFVGRTNELDALSTSLADGGNTVLISALAGAGGIGKTWLAVQWAHTHADRFPDGQLFVDLRGFSPDGAPLDPLTAVDGFLDALGIEPGRISGGLAEHAALYRSLVAGKRMLIVLDNAGTTEQVELLLPGTTTCTVLVTSRKTLTSLIIRYGARHLPLSVVDEHEARALLAQRLGDGRVAADPDATRELIGLCGRYPLALTIMAGRAQSHPSLSLSEFVTELRESGLDALDDDDPTSSLPTVLSWSLRGLTTEQRTTFALLGIAPGPDIGLPAASSLTGLPPSRARKVLRDLEDASLLERRAHDRYTMHDLIRAYAATTAHHELTSDTRDAAQHRMLDFYIHTARTAAHRLYPYRPPIELDPPAPGTRPHPLPDDPAAMQWFDTEHPNLLAAQHTATTHQRHHTVWQLAWTLRTFHYRRGHLRNDLTVWLAALDALEHIPDPSARIQAHRRVGHAYSVLGQHDEAIRYMHQALALTEQHDDPIAQAHTHHEYAWAWGRRGEDGPALDHARHALDLYRDLNQPVYEANALNTVGWHAARLGDYDTARAHCQAALAPHRHHDNPDGEANALDSLGYIDHHTGHHTQAIHHYEQALTLRRELGNTYDTADTLDSMGHPHAALGQHDQARTVWQEALGLYGAQCRTKDAERVQLQLRTLDV